MTLSHSEIFSDTKHRMPHGPSATAELLVCNGEENGKVIQNPHADLDQHQKLITSPLAHSYHV